MKDWFSKASISNYKRNLWCLYLTGLLAGAGIVLRNRICPSICPSFRLSILRSVQTFSWKCIVSFFQILARNSHEDVHDRAWFSGKKFLPPNLGKWTKNCWTKSRVFWNLLKNLVINFQWIHSVMKIYIICCVPAQTPYLGKILFLRSGPKYSQPIWLQDFLINHISRTSQGNSLIFSLVMQIHIN